MKVSMVRRHEVIDEQWKLIDPLLPARTAMASRKLCDSRQMLNGILWNLRTGARSLNRVPVGAGSAVASARVSTNSR
jgi:hypothetical protein